MKLGILLICIGVGDILLSVVTGAIVGFPIRLIIDIFFIFGGIARIMKKAKKAKAD